MVRLQGSFATCEWVVDHKEDPDLDVNGSGLCQAEAGWDLSGAAAAAHVLPL